MASVLVTRNMMSGQSRLMMWVWWAAALSACMGAVYLAVRVITGQYAQSACGGRAMAADRLALSLG